ncbi:MAG TPA: hypothetical protein VK642_07535 [Burkholderiales bacterium]|nr:hypothetical protein [Burkholderiales bacterium]
MTRLSISVLTKDQLAALGSIAAESTYLENLVDVVVSDVSGLNDEKLKIMIPSIMMQGKLEILKEFGLLKLKSKKLKINFSILIGELKHTNSERNQAIHGYWIDPQRGTGGLISSAMGNSIQSQIGDAVAIQLRHKKTPALSSKRLEAIAVEIAATRTKLFKFWKNHWISPSIRRQIRRAEKA